MSLIHVVGGGLAGSEAAWQLAERGCDVVLHEMRPLHTTPAHRTGGLAELVCSNTFKSTETTNAHGLLKAEMRLVGSMILDCADETRVPGGSAHTVDRDLFSAAVQSRIMIHPRIVLSGDEVTDIPSPAIIASGPLTSDALAQSIRARLGVDSLAFYDAIAPIVDYESVDHDRVFVASRYDKETFGHRDPHGHPERSAWPEPAKRREEGSAPAGEGAYINCPMTREQYNAFIDALIAADLYHPHDFERDTPYFAGCMPVEEMARRGRDTLRFGPMKPVGLRDPVTGHRPWAVVQLRREDRAGHMWNLVGFQTRLRYPEQQRVFRMIPGLEHAAFLRFGSMHRNSYVNSPAALTPHLSLRDDPAVLFAGQITGVEGYTESTATGIIGAINLARVLGGQEPVVPPPSTMLGALYRHLRDADAANFQPMNANFGLIDELPEPVKDRRLKRERLAERALSEMQRWNDGVVAEMEGPVAASR